MEREAQFFTTFFFSVSPLYYLHQCFIFDASGHQMCGDFSSISGSRSPGHKLVALQFTLALIYLETRTAPIG